MLPARAVMLASADPATEEAESLRAVLATAAEVRIVQIADVSECQEAVDLVVICASRALPADTLAAATAVASRAKAPPVVMVVAPGGLGPLASWREAGVAECCVAPLFLEDVQRLLGSPPLPRPIAAAGPADARRAAPSPPDASGLRVLLADDDPISLKFSSLYLERLGHRVTTAANGALALDAYARGEFDLLITDVQMPLIEGGELLGRICAMERGRRRLPVVAVTAHAMHGDLERFLAEGFDAVLSKPLAKKTLEEAIARVCPT